MRASLRSHLGDAAAVAAPWRVELPLVLPSVSVSSASEPEVGDLALPTSTSLEHSALLRAFTRTITEAELRRFDIADVVAMLDVVDRLERALHAAGERCVDLIAYASVAESDATQARDKRRAAEQEWRSSTQAWLQALRQLATGIHSPVDVAFDDLSLSIERPNLLEAPDHIVGALTNAAQGGGTRN